MIRLNITTEGHTELNFVKKLLAPHLALSGVQAFARSVRTSKDNRTNYEYRGGLIRYQKAKTDILNWVKEDRRAECHFTTMFDLYALPDDFPGQPKSKSLPPYKRVERLEGAFGEDLGARNFIPYIQLHEFEALILADPAQLGSEYLEHGAGIKGLIAEVGGLSPEEVNDGPDTAPSKRIMKWIKDYDKATAGVAVAARIGLPKLRAKCPHFNHWVTRLEGLGRG